MDQSLITFIYTLLVLSVFLILFEFFWAKRKGLRIHSWRENIPTIIILLVNLNKAFIVGSVVALFLSLGMEPVANFLSTESVLPIVNWVESNLFYPIAGTGALRWFALFLTVDLMYYFSHRLNHKVNFIWATHFAHHSITSYNILAAHRDPVFFLRFGKVILLLMLPVFTVFKLSEVAFMHIVIGIYSTWLHVSFCPKLPYLDWIFTTPSHHRMHHSLTNQDRTMAVNFGGVLIIWDRLFGTFLEEKENNHVFGVKGFNQSERLISVLFFQWKQIFIQLMRSRSYKEAFSVIFWKI